MEVNERIMRLLASHDRPMLTRQLVASLEIPRSSFCYACQRLQHFDLVTSPARGRYALTDTGRRLLEAGGPFSYQRKGKGASSAGRTLRQRAWSVMRMADHFTVDSLLQVISDGGSASEEHNIRRYCGMLYRAGFLGKTARTRAYFLRQEANTGPLAPAYTDAVCCVTDRNTGKVYPLGDAK